MYLVRSSEVYVDSNRGHRRHLFPCSGVESRAETNVHLHLHSSHAHLLSLTCEVQCSNSDSLPNVAYCHLLIQLEFPRGSFLNYHQLLKAQRLANRSLPAHFHESFRFSTVIINAASTLVPWRSKPLQMNHPTFL